MRIPLLISILISVVLTVLLAIVGVVRSAMAKNWERARQSPRRRGICA